MKKKHTPPLKDRNRTFPSSKQAAVELGLPSEVLALARERGAANVFHQSNRVNEKAFLEWLIWELRGYERLPFQFVSTPEDEPDYITGFDFDRLRESPPVTFPLDLDDQSFQVWRLLYGDDFASEQSHARTATILKASEKWEPARKAFVSKLNQLSTRNNTLPLPSVYTPNPEAWNMEDSPFRILGIDDVRWWQVDEEGFKGENYWDGAFCEWRKIGPDEIFPSCLKVAGGRCIGFNPDFRGIEAKKLNIPALSD